MKKILFVITLLSFGFAFSAVAQEKATGFSNIVLFIDPGHYGTYNQGYGGYSEAEKVLRVGLALKEYLIAYTDMKPENIVLSRLTDTDAEITMTERGNICRAIGAHLLYSIHSDAPSITAFSTLYLHGGRREVSGGQVFEKLPEGGKQFGDILNGDLTGVLRAIRSDGGVRPDASRGNVADLTFYSGTGTTPWLGVNNSTNGVCASLLSEAGFHTNPAQNMQFINAEHKRMQAYAAYQSLVKYLSEKHLGGRKNPVQVGIVTGFVFDDETMAPVNGAKITVTEEATEEEPIVKTYTTNTYASLPKKYEFKEDEFGNGFYWMEGFTPGATVKLKVEANGFEGKETELTIPASVGATTIDGLGVADFKLLNLMPSKVKNIQARYDMSNKVVQRYPIDIIFTRKMDKPSVESALSFTPAADVALSWLNDFTLRIDISKLEFETVYQLTIDGSLAKNALTGNLLDGVGNGTEGSDYKFEFTTCDLDTAPPVVVSYDPQGNQEISVRPIVRIEFDEPLNELTIALDQIVVTDKNGANVEGQISYRMMSNYKSVVHFLFYNDLNPNETYDVKLKKGVEDWYGNAIDEDFKFSFKVRPRERKLVTELYKFDNTMGSGWWSPDGSGSTTGINVSTTKNYPENNEKAIVESGGSVRIDYQWLSTAANPLVRWHNANTTPKFSTASVIQYYLFGDGSNSRVAAVVRNGASDSGLWGHALITINWVGWKLITWDMAKDPVQQYLTTVNETFPANANWNFSCFLLYPAPAAERVYEVSSIYFSQLHVYQLGDFVDYEVKFDSQGGSSVASVFVADGNKITRPTNPTFAGHAFGGWFKDAACTNEWNFANDVVTGNMTLYAKWTVAFTVTFDSQGGSKVPSIDVEAGAKISKPVDPTLAGYMLAGWFKDAACTNEWNFANDAVTGNITLYAKWIVPPAKVYANIFASELKASAVSASNDVDFSYTLNANASMVTITVSNGDVFQITNASDLTKGTHTVKRRLVVPSAAGKYTWTIKAVGVAANTNTGTAPVKFTSDDDLNMMFYSPRGGLAMDKNQNSPYFGRIYVANSLATPATWADAFPPERLPQADGIFILNAALQDVTGQGKVSYRGGVNWELNGTAGADMSPYRISVAPDGRVFLPKYWSTPGLWIMNPANPNADFSSAFGSADIYSRPIQSHLIDKDLYLFEQIGETNSLNYRIVRFEDFSAGHTDAGTAITTNSRMINNFSSCIPDGNGGWWVAQNRAGDDAPSIMHFAEDGTYNFGALRSELGNLSIARGGVAYNKDKNLLALGTASNVRIYQVNWNGGVPALSNTFLTVAIGGTNADGLEFDPANNLYMVSASTERMTGWALPNATAADNFFITSAPSSQPVNIINATNNHTVTFDTQVEGITVTPKTVTHGEKVTEPAPPIRTGYTFGGWFKDAACTHAWNFESDVVESDLTLFAKWVIISYTVTFDSQGGSKVDPITVNHGDKVKRPTPDPTLTNRRFVGW